VAYAETWSGLKDNILSNIGIIGEALLQGLFEDGKKGMAEFLQVLRESEALKQWARDTGETLRNVFSTIVGSVKTVISWWSNLDGSTKKMILTIAGITVVAGPILKFLSKLINGFKLVSGALVAMTSPVGLVTAAIAGLIAIFVTLYRQNEDFRKSVQNVWGLIKETIPTVIQAVSDFVKQVWGALRDWWNKNGDSILQKALEIWNFIYETISTIISEVVGFVIDIFGGLVEWWQEHGQMILQAAQNVWNVISTVITTAINVIWAIMQALWPVVQTLVITTWEVIKGVIQGAINVITGIIEFFAALFTGNWSALWDSIKNILSGAVQFIWNFIQLSFIGRIVKGITGFAKTFTKVIKDKWDTVKLAFMYAIDFVKGLVSRGFGAIRNFVTTIMNAIRSIISSVWNGIRNTISNVVNGIRNTISNIFNSLRGIVSSAFNGVRSAVTNGMTSAFNVVKNFFGRFKDAGKNIVTSIADGIKGAISKVTNAIKNVASKIRNFLPFSPAKEGPLKDLDKLDFGGTISLAIDDGANEVQKAMERALSFDLTQQASLESASNMKGNEVVRLLNELIQAVKEGKNIVINDREMGRVLEPTITEFQKRNQKVRSSFA